MTPPLQISSTPTEFRPTAFARAFGAITRRLGPFAGLRIVRLGQRVITQSHVGLYRLFGGGVFAHLGPAPVLLLTTTGRRTGKKRTTPLIYVPADELGLVASNSGAKSDPFWYRNLLANPHATVTLGRKTWSVVAEAAEGERRREIWREAVRLYPAYADYQESTSRQLPVLVLRQVSREP